jgi:hypothetical protein
MGIGFTNWAAKGIVIYDGGQGVRTGVREKRELAWQVSSSPSKPSLCGGRSGQQVGHLWCLAGTGWCFELFPIQISHIAALAESRDAVV